VRAKNKNGETALHGAAYRGFPAVAQLLVDRGAELDVPNLLGGIPLKVADGVFYAGIFKQQPGVSVLLRETYAKRGLPVPAKPDTTGDATAKAQEKNGIGPTGGLPVVGIDKPPTSDKPPAADRKPQ